MMFAMLHQVLPPANAPSSLLWLIGGGLVLVSLQLRRFRGNQDQPIRPTSRVGWQSRRIGVVTGETSNRAAAIKVGVDGRSPVTVAFGPARGSLRHVAIPQRSAQLVDSL
jgi:hypothetical protein